mgnify:CR=1 FL=1
MIQSQDQLWGLLIVGLSDRSLFIDDDLDILELLTHECVLILDNHRLVDELRLRQHALRFDRGCIADETTRRRNQRPRNARLLSYFFSIVWTL